MVLLVVLFLAYVVLIFAIFFIVLGLIVLGWRRVTANKTYCNIQFDWKEPCVVGQLVTFRISLTRLKAGTTIKSTPSPLQAKASEEFLRDTFIEIRQALAYHSTHNTKIEYVKELDKNSGELLVNFSVRRSGLYIISVNYKGVRAVGSPFRKRFKPCSIDASKTVFLRPSPTITCIAEEEITHEIQPRDKYGNDCDETIWLKNEQNIESRLQFVPKFVEEDSSDCPVPQEQISHVFITKRDGSRIEVIICVQKPGVYRGNILYDDKPISNGQFDVLCITRMEYGGMLQIAQNSPAWTSHQALIKVIGEEDQTKHRKAYLYVSPKLFSVLEYVFKVIPWKLATYRVSSMTKVRIIKILPGKDGEDNYIFSVFDGIQPKLMLEMSESKARILFALYFNFLHKRLGGCESFERKQKLFYQELKGTQNDLRMTTKQITISRPNLVYASMHATKYWKKSDWQKNFGIKFENENGYDYGGLRREWLELLCVQFFQNSQHGMFRSIGTSRLVHPNPSNRRYPLWTLKHYEFAGKVVGKCLFESSQGDLYTQMVNGKFSRSFLAQVLGLPANYQHFEQDDPELFVSKIKYILENDVNDMDLTFAEEEYDEKGKLVKTVELIPGGSSRSVTVDNKEQYLNALAKYRLESQVTKEIDSFKRGLFEIVPEELFVNFDNENELELLLCGKSEFDIEDLKENSIRDWNWGTAPNKIYSWFCSAVANMDDDERGRLLQFTTGSSLLPLGGFKALNPKFRISISNDFGKLPRAHTCFHTISLSDHENYEQFERSLRIAITEGAEGFSFT